MSDGASAMRVNDVETTSEGLFLPRVFQVAYVTRNLPKAQALLEQRFGISRWQHMRDMENKPGTFVTLANARVGDMAVEIIEVGDVGEGGETIWHQLPLLEGEVMRFHHFGHIYYTPEEWDRVVAGVEKEGVKVAERASFGDLIDFIYVDERAMLGHWIEYIYCKPAGRALFAEFPAN